MDNRWNSQDSAELYNIANWGAPFFDINDQGHVSVAPSSQQPDRIDLKTLIDSLRRRGIKPPILVRFNDILQSRIEQLHTAFSSCIQAYDYHGHYRSVMPIKVNQQRHVIEKMLQYGQPHHLGLEAGSRPELLIAMAMLEGHEGMMICNGYKDREYIEMVFNAERLGLNPILVLDRYAELDMVLALSQHMGFMPALGLRAKLTSRGSGRWEKSSGDSSKFGLSAQEMVNAIATLGQHNHLNSLKMLHFHIGSQVTAIRSIKTCVRESAHVYCHLRQMGATELKYIDVGGGLAVDYDGSRTNFHSSKNYSMQEYANDVVSEMQTVCDAANIDHPNIISESGRALVAHHSVLIFDVLGSHRWADTAATASISAPTQDDHQILHLLWEAHQNVTLKNVQEIYNDAISLKEESGTLFAHGVIDLECRAKIETLFWSTCARIARLMEKLDYVPEDLERLQRLLCDTFFCNFSVFQSLPDSWAVGHLFPIMPLHRLNTKPTRQAVLADLTCDSDGKLEHFIDLHDVRSTLPLHAPNDEPYYVGAFLVGAYQETLGDLHNLFGDTHAVHVSLEEDGRYRLEDVVVGDTVNEVLSYVEYDRNELLRRVRCMVEKALRQERISFEDSAEVMQHYEKSLAGYTYLNT